jgi:hypothetical protein
MRILIETMNGGFTSHGIEHVEENRDWNETIP